MPTSTYTALATVTLGGSDQDITFASIPGTYRDLILVVEGTSNVSSNAFLQFNGDTTSGNYSNLFANSDGSTTSSGVSATGTYIGGIYGSNRSINIIQVMDYSATDKHKTRLSRMSVAGAEVSMIASRWANTAAVTSMTFTLAGNTMSTGAILSLYGIVS
jgi:hypothetical protein